MVRLVTGSFGVTANFDQRYLSPARHWSASFDAPGFQVLFPSFLANESTGDIVAQNTGRVVGTDMERYEKKTSQVMSWLADAVRRQQDQMHELVG